MGKPDKFLPLRGARGSYIEFDNASAAVAAKETEEGGGQDRKRSVKEST